MGIGTPITERPSHSTVHMLRHEVADYIVNLLNNLLYHQQFLTSACITGNGNVRSPRDKVALNLRVERENRERISILTASSRMGAKNDGMCNICKRENHVTS